MSFDLSVALLEATAHLSRDEDIRGEARQLPLGAGFNALVGLVDILDVPFEHQQVRRTLAIDLQRTTIIPLDRAFDLFTIKQNDDHGSVSIDLFLVVEDLSIGFTGRWNSLLYLDR